MVSRADFGTPLRHLDGMVAKGPAWPLARSTILNFVVACGGEDEQTGWWSRSWPSVEIPASKWEARGKGVVCRRNSGGDDGEQ